MKKFINSASAFFLGAVISLVFFLLPPFIAHTALPDQEVSSLSKMLFVPLFLIGTLWSFFYKKKTGKENLLYLGLLFTGVLTVLLAFLNVYHLQMALPLLKTNSIELVVMWMARGFGGLLGLFLGLSFGSLLEKQILPFVFLVIGAVVVVLLGLLAPKILPYEAFFYSIGFLSLGLELFAVCRKQNEKE